MKPIGFLQQATILLALAIAGWSGNGSPAIADEPTRAEELADKLTQVVKFRGYDDPKTTLADVIAQWQKTYDLTLTVNERAFQRDTVAEPLKTEIADPTPIPPMKARLSDVLKEILKRIPASSGAAYLIRRNSVEIMTLAAIRAELGRDEDEPLPPLVHVTLKDRPLGEALKILAERADFSVLLDNRVKNKAKTLVSATFKNVPLDTAVRLLADMAELEAVLVEDALYVTTPENAAALEKEQRKRQNTQPNR